MNEKEANGPSRRALLIVLAVPAAILLGLTAWKLIPLLGGTTVHLQPYAVDPRDPFRGDYVILRYPISNLDLTQYGANAGDHPEDSTIYLVLRDTQPTDQPVRVSRSTPALNANEACLKGEVTSAGGNRASVQYGLESYFVPENRGREVEEALREKRVIAEIKTTSGCNAVLRTLLIDGQPWP